MKIIMIVVVFCFIIRFGLTGEERPSALSVFVDYSSNRIGANSKYKLKELTITGMIREIGRSKDESFDILLVHNDIIKQISKSKNNLIFIRLDLDPFKEDYFICFFSEDKAKQFENLSVWNEVVISGVLLDAQPTRFPWATYFTIIMVDCTIIEAKKSKINLMLEEAKIEESSKHEN